MWPYTAKMANSALILWFFWRVLSRRRWKLATQKSSTSVLVDYHLHVLWILVTDCIMISYANEHERAKLVFLPRKTYFNLFWQRPTGIRRGSFTGLYLPRSGPAITREWIKCTRSIETTKRQRPVRQVPQIYLPVYDRPDKGKWLKSCFTRV